MGQNKIANDKKKSKVKILHIEDDKDLSSIIAIALNALAEPTSVNNLIEAEKALSENIFDIIILDYKFPEGTCEKLIDNIKFTHNKNAKLILFSAFEPNYGLAQKFDAIILKSKVSYEQFLNCIKKLLDN